MSRGSSILAGLILAGALSALAVVLDGSGAAVRVAQHAGSQVATSYEAEKGTVEVVAKTKDAVKEGEIRQCEPNFNYKVLVDPKSKAKTLVVCEIPDNSLKPVPLGTQRYRCPGTTAGCSNASPNKTDDALVVYDQLPVYTSCRAPECTGEWMQKWKAYCERDSRLKLCTPQDVDKAASSKEDDKSCVFSSCNLKDADKGVISQAKKGAAKNLPSLLKGTKDPETLEALKSTQGVLKADKATSEILGKAFAEAGKEVEADLTRVDESIAESRRRLEELRYGANCTEKDSEKCREDELAERRKLEDLENRRKQLLAQKERLASAAKELESKEGPPGTKKEPPGTYSQSGYGPGGPGTSGPSAGQSEACRRCQANPSDRVSCMQCAGNQGGSTFPMMPMQPQVRQGQGQGQNPQQCYNYQQYSAQNNAYCSNGSIYAYNSQTCQYQIQLQCPSGQCNTQQLTTDSYGRQISTQCAPTIPTNIQLSAQLTCSPRRIDLGSSVTLTYSCSQGTATGNGFTASGQNGTATVTPDKPPRGSTSVTYGLTCTGPQGQTVQAAPCQVEVGVPTIVIVASPQNVESGKHTTLGWVTRGIKSCVIQSTDDRHREWNDAQKDKTNPSGTAKSPDLTADTVFELTCKTQEDKEKKSNVTVRIKG